MPKAMLLGERETRREWLESRGLYTFAEQWAAERDAQRHYNIPDPPDPRLIYDRTDN